MAAKDIFEKDYYQVLGVSKTADSAAIKKQYRKLARELHPDKTKGDKKLEDRFKAVSEAYDVLGDDKKRAEYDQARAAFASGRIPPGFGVNQSGGFSGSFNGADFSDLFGSDQDIFSTIFGGGSRSRRGSDLQTQTTISFKDSIKGTELNLNLRPQNSAPINVTTRVPAGIKDGSKIKLKGRGAPGAAGAAFSLAASALATAAWAACSNAVAFALADGGVAVVLRADLRPDAVAAAAAGARGACRVLR